MHKKKQRQTYSPFNQLKVQQHQNHEQQPKPFGVWNAFYWYQIFALDSVVVKTQNWLARMEAS